MHTPAGMQILYTHIQAGEQEDCISRKILSALFTLYAEIIHFSGREVFNVTQ